MKHYYYFYNSSDIPVRHESAPPLVTESATGISGERVLNENVIRMVKRFKIIADRYRNRRKRFGLRFNLITGIYNYEL
jgi:hypothetical protein